MVIIKLLVAYLLLIFSVHTFSASSFYKCVVKGRVIYSEFSCEKGAKLNTIEDVYIGEAVQDKPKSAQQQLKDFLKIKGPSTTSPKKKKTKSSCDGVSTLKLRNAVIQDKLMKCHSKSDVMSIYGSPVSIATYSDRPTYDSRWLYKLEGDQTIYIYFKDGVVTKWEKHE